jgi:3-hydroxybutyryl-CoA dehydrogenase
MSNIYIIGEVSVNNEIKNLFPKDNSFAGNLSDEVDFIFDSSNYPYELKKENIAFIDNNITKPIPVFSSVLCTTTSSLCSVSKFPERIIGIGLYNSISNAKILEIAPSKITDKTILKNAEYFLKKNNINYNVVPDMTGLVFLRILSMIINEAAQVYSENIAACKDIDIAMKLGTSYPFGPLEWADKLGIDLVYNILSSLQRDFGDDRYRPHPVLKEMINLNFLGIKTKKGFYEY